MSTLRASVAIIWLAAAVMVAGFAVGASGLFTDSDPVGGNTFATDTLDPPTSLTATGGASIDLSWTATADTYASGHRVLRATATGGPYTQIAEVTPRATTAYTTDCPADGTYYYVARAFFQNWESANSNEASVTAAPVAVTFPAQTVASTFANNPTLAHTSPAGTDTMIVVTVAGVGGAGKTTVSYAGAALTKLLDFTGNSQQVQIWYKVNPASGNNNVTSTGGGNMWWTAKTFHGVDQTNPFGSPADTNTATGTSGNPAVTITTSADSMTTEVNSFKEETGTDAQVDPTNANSVEDSDSVSQVEPRGVDSHTDDTGAITVGWTQQNGTRWAIAVADMKPAASCVPGAVVILDAWTTGTTHTVSAGTDRLLLVSVYGEDSGVISSVNTVTWGGQTLTEISEVTVGSGDSNLVWMGYLNDAGIAAASGSTIVATWSGDTPDESVLYAAVTLENVDQTTPIGGSSNGTNTNASTVQIASALTVDTSDMAVYVTGSGAQGETHTADTGYTEGTEQDSGGDGQVASNATKAITANGSEQPTATWSSTNNRLAIVGAVINVAP